MWSQDSRMCSTQSMLTFHSRALPKVRLLQVFAAGLHQAAGKFFPQCWKTIVLYVTTQRCYPANNCKMALRCQSKMLPLVSGTVLAFLKDNRLSDLHSSEDWVCWNKGEAERRSETFQTAWNVPSINRPSCRLDSSDQVCWCLLWPGTSCQIKVRSVSCTLHSPVCRNGLFENWPDIGCQCGSESRGEGGIRSS